MVLNETFVMNNGVEIPKLSLGTWQIPDAVAEDSVLSALKVGYRHIDTAVIYRNEEGVGRGIVGSNVPREEIFVTTKVPDRVKDPVEVERIFNESLQRLGVEYVDLLLIHAPKAWEEIVAKTEKDYYAENLAVWSVMEKLYKEGKCRSIGVSNFEIHDIQNLLDHAEIKPQVNQIKVHIGYYPKDLVDYCQANDILVEAYSPNATGKLRENPVVVAMAEKYVDYVAASSETWQNTFDLMMQYFQDTPEFRTGVLHIAEKMNAWNEANMGTISLDTITSTFLKQLED